MRQLPGKDMFTDFPLTQPPPLVIDFMLDDLTCDQVPHHLRLRHGEKLLRGGAKDVNDELELVDVISPLNEQ